MPHNFYYMPTFHKPSMVVSSVLYNILISWNSMQLIFFTWPSILPPNLKKKHPSWWTTHFFRHRRCWKSKRQIERHISSAGLRRSDVLSIELEGKGIPVHFYCERGARTRCCGVCVWCFVFFIGREGSKDIECWYWRDIGVAEMCTQELWYGMGVWMIGFI